LKHSASAKREWKLEPEYEYSASGPSCFTPDTQWGGSLMDPRASVDTVRKQKIAYPCQQSLSRLAYKNINICIIAILYSVKEYVMLVSIYNNTLTDMEC
jgi:hypothetical protein